MKYNTIILHSTFETIINSLKKLYTCLDNDGNVFCILSTEYDKNGNVSHDFFEVIDFASKQGYYYINTIVFPMKNNKTSEVNDNVKYIVWFCKDKKKNKFNKDPIREKSIWKDVEWGRRAKNYNILGKDPGNVWIPTTDDRKGKITSHVLLNISKIIDRIVSSTTDINDNLYLITNDKEISDYKYLDRNIVIEYLDSDEKNNNTNNIYRSNNRKNIEQVYGKVVFGTSEKMDEIKDATVALVVTSPPYWDLKNYYKKGQIGQEEYEKYANRMFSVWKECSRILKQDGDLWININIRVKNNEVILLPWLFINQCKKLGFYYKGIIIWHKSSGIPTTNKNLVDRHEYVLIFSKAEDKKHHVVNYRDYKNEYISNGYFWNINRKAGSVGKNTIHPAIFPVELINRIINVSSNKGDIVVDPFLGSGTSMISAINNKRNFIGYEYYEGFDDLIKSRVASELKEEENIIEYKYTK